MPAFREIRAAYDRDSIVVYQAYNDAIAEAALQAIAEAVGVKRREVRLVTTERP